MSAPAVPPIATNMGPRSKGEPQGERTPPASPTWTTTAWPPASPTGVASLAGSLLSRPSTAPSSAPPTPRAPSPSPERPPRCSAGAAPAAAETAGLAEASATLPLPSAGSLGSRQSSLESSLDDAAAVSASASAADLAAAAEACPPSVDVELVVHRLRAGAPGGQVVVWAWAQAARLSAGRGAMPAELLSQLWPAALACADRLSPQDLLGLLSSWHTLLANRPRHFPPSGRALQALAELAFPPAVKRMGEGDLRQLGSLCAELALAGADPLACGGLGCAGSGGGASARDLLRPLFSLAATEVAWRLQSPLRYVSQDTVAGLLEASAAWRWAPSPGCRPDPPALAALLSATRSALELLRAAAAADTGCVPAAAQAASLSF